MTQDGDKIDRIEAALDRQVAVNADLRTSVAELKASTAQINSTAESLLQVVIIHQQNFERLTAELNADRQEWKAQIQQAQEQADADRQEWKAQIQQAQERAERARLEWQAQIERIWQHLQQRGNG